MHLGRPGWVFLFWRGLHGGSRGKKGQLNPREEEEERDYCIADANEGT
jgi:hypothetical protein